MQIKSLDEVINRLQYKADNIKAKLEPSYFTECIDYLKSNVSEKLTSSTDLEIVASLPSLYPMMQDFEEEAILNVVASVNNDGWIPCSERLPEELQRVLVYTDKDSYYVAKLNTKGKWVSSVEMLKTSIDYQNVIAWRELPEPYQPKGE